MAIREKKTSVENATVIIPTYKRGNLSINLAKQINSKYPDIEILIINQKNLTNISRELPKNVRYFNLDTASLPYARNYGLSKAKNEIVIFFDDDITLNNQCIEAHIKGYKDVNVMGIAGRVINDNEVVPSETFVITGKINQYGTVFTAQFWGTKKQEVDYVYGCNMSFRKKALEKIGGFDTGFIPPLSAFEEIDLSLRIKKLGKILFIPEALAYHHKEPDGGTRSAGINRMNNYYYCYGRFLRKNFPNAKGLQGAIRRTITALKESPLSIPYFYKGLFNL